MSVVAAARRRRGESSWRAAHLAAGTVWRPCLDWVEGVERRQDVGVRMIAMLCGQLHARGSDWVILQVGGVGFQVRVPASIVGELGDVGETVRLYTHLLVRDDTIALYGFATPEQLELFELLLGVSGVGPRVALTLLSSTSPEILRLAIAREDVDLLTRVPGVGRKTASRLILELKGRIDLGRLGLPGVAALTPEQAELTEVLTSLGYTAAEARAAVASLPADSGEEPLEERLRLALQYFGGAGASS